MVSSPDHPMPARPPAPAQVAGYRLDGRLGGGATAEVYRATGPDGIPAAVKLFRDAAHGATCQHEYAMAAAVDRHCTARVRDHGVVDDRPYLAMEYLPGHTCGARIVAGTLPAARLRALARALAETLGSIHGRGIVHCDVKPANVLVNEDDVRLIDFGIARHVGEACGHDGIVHCSRGWAAPEQVRAAPATPAVDVFAWGCLMAYWATGTHPFASQSAQEWILRLQSAAPDLADMPPALEDIVAAALAPDPTDRPTAHQIAAACAPAHRRAPSPWPFRLGRSTPLRVIRPTTVRPTTARPKAIRPTPTAARLALATPTVALPAAA
jgi:serine/threonine protein kinase